MSLVILVVRRLMSRLAQMSHPASSHELVYVTPFGPEERDLKSRIWANAGAACFTGNSELNCANKRPNSVGERTYSKLSICPNVSIHKLKRLACNTSDHPPGRPTAIRQEGRQAAESHLADTI